MAKRESSPNREKVAGPAEQRPSSLDLPPARSALPRLVQSGHERARETLPALGTEARSDVIVSGSGRHASPPLSGPEAVFFGSCLRAEPGRPREAAVAAKELGRLLREPSELADARSGERPMPSGGGLAAETKGGRTAGVGRGGLSPPGAAGVGVGRRHPCFGRVSRSRKQRWRREGGEDLCVRESGGSGVEEAPRWIGRKILVVRWQKSARCFRLLLSSSSR